MTRVRVNGLFNVAALAGWIACSIPGVIDIGAGRLSATRAISPHNVRR
jgi:hypothetical protein